MEDSDEALDRSSSLPGEDDCPTLPTAWECCFESCDVLLGEGTFGKIWKVLDSLTGQYFAVKVVNQAVTAAHGLDSQLLNEVVALQTCSRCDCRYVVKYFDLAEESSFAFIRMELCSHGSLLQFTLQQPGGHLLEPLGARWARQLFEGLEDMHDLGIIHRDIKPENLLLADDASLRISDMGWAAKVGTTAVCLAGTFHYMAPEVLRLTAPHMETVDVWSAGVTLYEVLTGTTMLSCEEHTGLSEQNWPKALEVRIEIFLKEILKCCPAMAERQPSHLSSGCWNLLQLTTEPDVARRASVANVLGHPWLCAVQQHGRRKSPSVTRGRRSWPDLQAIARTSLTYSRSTSPVVHSATVPDEAARSLVKVSPENLIRSEVDTTPGVSSPGLDHSFHVPDVGVAVVESIYTPSLPVLLSSDTIHVDASSENDHSMPTTIDASPLKPETSTSALDGASQCGEDGQGAVTPLAPSAVSTAISFADVAEIETPSRTVPSGFAASLADAATAPAAHPPSDSKNDVSEEFVPMQEMQKPMLSLSLGSALTSRQCRPRVGSDWGDAVSTRSPGRQEQDIRHFREHGVQFPRVAKPVPVGLGSAEGSFVRNARTPVLARTFLSPDAHEWATCSARPTRQAVSPATGLFTRSKHSVSPTARVRTEASPDGISGWRRTPVPASPRTCGASMRANHYPLAMKRCPASPTLSDVSTAASRSPDFPCRQLVERDHFQSRSAANIAFLNSFSAPLQLPSSCLSRCFSPTRTLGSASCCTAKSADVRDSPYRVRKQPSVALPEGPGIGALHRTTNRQLFPTRRLETGPKTSSVNIPRATGGRRTSEHQAHVGVTVPFRHDAASNSRACSVVMQMHHSSSRDTASGIRSPVRLARAGRGR